MKNLIGLCVMVAFVAALTVSSIGCGGGAAKSTTVSTDKGKASTEVKTGGTEEKKDMPAK